MRCYLCGATSKALNDLTVKRNVNFESLNFGLSVLHAKIRLFESILHLAYKIPIGKWQVRSHEDKNTVAETKKRIQQKFKDVMGLLIDTPKAVFGNTNDARILIFPAYAHAKKKTQPFCTETIELLRPLESGVTGDESGGILDEENSENDEYSDSD